MTADELQKLKELCDRASPAPWQSRRSFGEVEMILELLIKKDGILYGCKPGRDGILKCGKCLKGNIPVILKNGILKNPVGLRCKVCSAKVTQWSVYSEKLK